MKPVSHPDSKNFFQLRSRLQAFAGEFDRKFADYLSPDESVPRELVDAVRYSALSAGKRLRPYLVVRCCEMVGGVRDAAWPVAAAVECIHAFSLIHDDLPAMDNDDLRRGQPTCHKKYGEALAILAGDSLIMSAFELMSVQTKDATTACRMVAELAHSAGWSGLIGGQVADVAGEGKPPTLDRANFIHLRKTARLFATACRLGAIRGGGNDEETAAVGSYGELLGRAFQIADDLLDVTSESGTLGKKTGKDEPTGKQSFPRCVGIEESREMAAELARSAIEALARFDSRADDLRELARYVVSRDY